MHQPGACGRIMLSEEAVHAKFVAVAQITPTKCYAGSFPCRERPEIHDKFHGSAVKQRSDHTIHILQDPVYLASVAHRKPLLERVPAAVSVKDLAAAARSEEHTSELQSLMRISYAVFCLKKKNQKHQ